MRLTPCRGRGIPAPVPGPSPRERVLRALSHQVPDRLPVDFLAVPEVWRELQAHFGMPLVQPAPDALFDPGWERVLQLLEVDCRVVSYDQFCEPPHAAGNRVEWWQVPGRSTPARMWRVMEDDGFSRDVFGRRFRTVGAGASAYEETVPVLDASASLADARGLPWPDPAWWDFHPLPGVIRAMNGQERHHERYRAGSVFEIGWQLMGLEQFLVGLLEGSPVPEYLMDAILDRELAVTRAALDAAGDGLDMLYFYDDVATQQSLLLSAEMWRRVIRPRHARLIELARGRGLSVMYHSDGAIAPLLPDLIAMGVDVINPVQADAAGMDPAALKESFGDKLSFHGGIDIVRTLPRGTAADVEAEVAARRRVLGAGGGYVMASCHHIQAGTPLANVLAMYRLPARE